MTYRCNINWFDSGECKYYEEGCSYEIDLEHMAKLGTLKRFDGAEKDYMAKSEEIKPETEEKPKRRAASGKTKKVIQKDGEE